MIIIVFVLISKSKARKVELAVQLSACDAATRLCSNAVESLGQPLPMHILHAVYIVHVMDSAQCIDVSTE